MYLKIYTGHSIFKYLVNKHLLGDKICRLLFTFQEYDFEVIVNPEWLNVGPYHLSRIETIKETTSLEEGLWDVKPFVIRVIDNHFANII